MWEKILREFLKKQIKELSEIQRQKREDRLPKQGYTSSRLTAYYKKLNELNGKKSSHDYKKQRSEFTIEEKIGIKTYTLSFCDWRFEIKETTYATERHMHYTNKTYQSWCYIIAMGTYEEMESKKTELEKEYADKIEDYNKKIAITREYEDIRREMYKEREKAYILFEQEWKEKLKPYDKEYERNRKTSADAFFEMKKGCIATYENFMNTKGE